VEYDIGKADQRVSAAKTKIPYFSKADKHVEEEYHSALSQLRSATNMLIVSDVYKTSDERV
jgi:hypothetical protein